MYGRMFLRRMISDTGGPHVTQTPVSLNHENPEMERGSAANRTADSLTGGERAAGSAAGGTAG